MDDRIKQAIDELALGTELDRLTRVLDEVCHRTNAKIDKLQGEVDRLTRVLDEVCHRTNAKIDKLQGEVERLNNDAYC